MWNARDIKIILHLKILIISGIIGLILLISNCRGILTLHTQVLQHLHSHPRKLMQSTSPGPERSSQNTCRWGPTVCKAQRDTLVSPWTNQPSHPSTHTHKLSHYENHKQSRNQPLHVPYISSQRCEHLPAGTHQVTGQNPYWQSRKRAGRGRHPPETVCAAAAVNVKHLSALLGHRLALYPLQDLRAFGLIIYKSEHHKK